MTLKNYCFQTQFFNHPEGYVKNDNEVFNYVYQYKDHLGNVRVSYTDPTKDYQLLLNHDFSQGTQGWEYNGVSMAVENKKLKTTVNGAYEGPNILIGNNFTVGQKVKISIYIDKGNTNKVRRYLYESDANGTTIGFHQVDVNAQTGYHTFEHTIVSGPRLSIKLDKSDASSDIGTNTYFFIDNFHASKGKLEIIEESNYYPFGLKHKGYNNVTNTFGNSVAQKFGYNGKELNESLGLNIVEMDFRQYDSAIGRFNGMDRLTELVPSMTPYRFAFNNPNYWSDPTGLFEQNYQATCPTCPNTPAFQPYIDDPNNLYIYNQDTNDVSLLLPEIVVNATPRSESNNDNNWWVIDLLERNRNFDRPFNITLGAYGAVATTTQAWLQKERKAFEKQGTKTATKKIKKYVKPSIDKVKKFGSKIGYLGAAVSAGSLGYDIVSGQEITAGQVFDTALSVGLSFIAISNPVGLLALGAFTVIDMYGGFDGLKESIGESVGVDMNAVIINEK